MSAFRLLRSRAMYNILTPAALLGAGLALATPALAFNVSDPYSNSANITTPLSGGAITSFTNTGSINVDTPSDDAIDLLGISTAFVNSGTITNAQSDLDTLAVEGTVASFDNTATGVMSEADGTVLDFGGLVTTFSNEGTLRNNQPDEGGAPTVIFDSGVTTFTNGGSGQITNLGEGNAVEIVGADGVAGAAVTTFVNNGTINSSDDGDAVLIDAGDSEDDITPTAAGSILNGGNVYGADSAFDIHGDVGSFTNTKGGLIQGNDGDAVIIEGNLTGTFSNAGAIRSFSGKGVAIEGTTNTFVNSNSIEGQGEGVELDGDVTSFQNLAGATITGDEDDGVFISGTVLSFVNGGSIAGADTGFTGEGYITNFSNTGKITGARDSGVLLTEGVGIFSNAGSITGSETGCGCFDALGVGIEGPVTEFDNFGQISGHDAGVVFGNFVRGDFDGESASVGTFKNAGTITGLDGPGVLATNVSNDGETALALDFGSFTNSGSISGRYYGVLVNNDTAVSIVNTGTITGWGNSPSDTFSFDGELPAGIFLADMPVGLQFNGNPDGSTLNNSGKITGSIGVNVVLADGDEASIVNSGSIIGTSGPGILFSAAEGSDPTVETSGLISGAGVSIEFAGSSPDTLKVDTGAKFVGTVDFGPGANTFDFSDYHGNMLFSFDPGTGTLTQTAGSNLNAQSGDTIGIVDGTSVADAAQPVEDLVGGIQDSLHDALNGTSSPASDGFVANYAPSKPASKAAAAAMDVGKPAANGDTTFWGDAFGGGDTNSSGAGTNTQFGGLVVGAQSEFSPGLTLGLLGSYGRTNFNIVNGPQTITTDTGVLGVYGATSFDTVGLDFSVLAGFGSNNSSRTITTMTGDEIGKATFGSWFIAPQVGATIPVLTTDKGVFNVAAHIGYIGGGFAGYSETGSAADITVGSETIGIFDARAELNGKTVLSTASLGAVVLSGKVGIYSDDNVGGSTVPVTVLGLPAGTVAGTGATGFGAYAGAGVEMPVSDGLTVGASVTGSARSDGTYGGIGKFRISGSY